MHPRPGRARLIIVASLIASFLLAIFSKGQWWSWATSLFIAHLAARLAAVSILGPANARALKVLTVAYLPTTLLTAIGVMLSGTWPFLSFLLPIAGQVWTLSIFERINRAILKAQGLNLEPGVTTPPDPVLEPYLARVRAEVDR